MSTGHQTAIQPWEAQLFTAAVLDQQFSKTKTLEDSTPLQNKIKMTFKIILKRCLPFFTMLTFAWRMQMHWMATP